MELFTAADAGSIVTGVTGVITSNVPAIISLVIFTGGLTLARKMLNRGLKSGRV